MSFFPSISQNVTVDTANSESGASIVTYVNPADIWNYDGVGTSTLGVNGIQIVVTSTQNLTIYVDQGNANNAFQITDTFNYLTTQQFGITVQAVGAFVRVRAKNLSGTTATATIDTVLCPIVEALPRALNNLGYLKTFSYGTSDEYGFNSENTPTGEERTVVPIRQVGVAFEGSTLDPNFWSTILLAGGTITQNNARVDLLTNTTANGSATLFSNRKARHIAGGSQVFRMVGRFGDAGTANNVRQFGVGLGSNYTLTISSASVVAGDIYSDISGIQYTILKTETTVTPLVFATGAPTAGARTYTRVSGSGPGSLTGSGFTINSTLTDGFFFQLSGTTFSVVTAIGGDITTGKIDSGSFNGNLGATYIPNANMQNWEIYYNSTTAWFAINGELLHTVVNNQTPLSNTLTLHAFIRTVNFNDGTTNAAIYARSLTIKQLGPIETEKIWKYVVANTTTILKYGAGRLYKIIFGDPMLAQVVTLYDGMSAAAPIITKLTNVAQANNLYRCHTAVDFNMPFFNGLTMVTSTTAPVTIIYE